MRHHVARTLTLSLGLSGMLAALAPHEAAAQEEANGLGDKGELIVTVDRMMPLFSYTNESVTTQQGGQETTTSDSSTSIALLFGREPSLTNNPHTIPRLALDYTIINHLTLGGAFVLGVGLGGSHTRETGNNTQKTDAPKVTAVGLAVRAGWVVPLAHTFAFWPRAGFAFYSLSAKQDITGNNNNTQTVTNTDSVWSLDLDPQFAWVPLQHFFAHFGPLVNIPLTGSQSVETVQGGTTNTTKNDLSIFHVGISAGIGGWFDF